MGNLVAQMTYMGWDHRQNVIISFLFAVICLFCHYFTTILKWFTVLMLNYSLFWYFLPFYHNFAIILKLFAYFIIIYNSFLHYLLFMRWFCTYLFILTLFRNYFAIISFPCHDFAIIMRWLWLFHYLIIIWLLFEFYFRP